MPLATNAAGELDWLAWPGAAFPFELVYKVAGVPVGLTGCAARLKVLNAAGAAVIDGSTGTGMIDPPGSDGRIVGTIPAGSVPANGFVGRAIVTLTFPGKTEQPLTAGEFRVRGDPPVG